VIGEFWKRQSCPGSNTSPKPRRKQSNGCDPT
jgi:hypothetical protein